ncbi:MAG: type II and III secretion system protein family protein [Phycisphaerae bacterium]
MMQSRTPTTKHGILAATLLCLVCVTERANAAAPPTAGSSTDFRASVVDIASVTQQVTVPLNRSVIIETSVETSRADVVASQIADVQPVSPTQLLVTGKAYGRTDVVLWDKTEHQYLLDVTVELDLESLSEVFKKIDPQSRVEARSVMGNIVLTGTVTSAQTAKRIEEFATLFLPPMEGDAPVAVQNHLDVAGEQQVLLRCVVAEVSRKATRELGINGFLAGDNVRDAFLVNQLGGINPINIGAAANASATQPIPFLTGADGIPLSPTPSLSLGVPRAQMQLFIKAMAENALLTVLAEPNLVAISGETASFLAGGEFPILEPQGNQVVSISYREFGVRLNFTPEVKGQQRIRLRVRPEVSELDPTASIKLQGFDVPGLKTRAAETIVEVGSGQTIAIAGLLNEETNGLASRIPGIGDVPIIGALFRSVRYQRNLSELVILVTPEIVAPLDAHQYVDVPARGIKSPSDFELYALGLLEGGELDQDDAPCGDENSQYAGRPLASQPEEMSIHGPWGHAQPGEAQ